MAPKRKRGGAAGRGGGRGKKAKTEPAKATGPPDLTGKETYCSEVGIDIEKGGSEAVYQWLCCSIVFGNRLSEQTTIRAAKGLINSGLTDPKTVKEASWQEKIDALNSEGNVQRGPSMSDRLGATAEVVLDKYEGDLGKLREAGNKDPAKIRKLVKEFKGIGETGVDIFFREAQLQWEELFPFADKNSLKAAKTHGYPSTNAKALAEFVGNDKKKFVALLAAMTKDELRNTDILEGGEVPGANDDKKADGKAEEKKEEAGEEAAEKADEPMKEADEKEAKADGKKEDEEKEGEKKDEEKAEANEETEKKAEKGDEEKKDEPAAEKADDGEKANE